jgi:hypothetical protein
MKIFISVLAVFLMFGCGGDEKKSTHTSSTQEHEAHKVTKTTPVRTEAAAHEESTQAQTMVEETQAQTATMADEVELKQTQWFKKQMQWLMRQNLKQMQWLKVQKAKQMRW